MQLNSIARLAAAIATISLLATASPAEAARCADELYRHNGSVLRLSDCGGKPVRLTYQQPLRGLERHGVAAGSVMFVGRKSPGGRLKGTVWVFKRACGRIGFIVHGRMDDERIILGGRAPIRNGACDIVRTAAHELVFERQRGGLATRGLATSGAATGGAVTGGATSRAKAAVAGMAGPSQLLAVSCRGENSAFEKAICSNNALSALDHRMVNFYTWLYSYLKGFRRERLARDQRDWIARDRNSCGANAPCLRSAYLNRLAAMDELLLR